MAYGRDSYRPGRVPKVVRTNAGRNEAAVYKNLGDSQRIKFLWAERVTLAGNPAQYEVIASGTFGGPKTGERMPGRDSYLPGGGFYGKTLADMHVWATPLDTVGGNIWVDIDIGADTVTVYSTIKGDAGAEVDVLFFTT
jgi:hypothetical protein